MIGRCLREGVAALAVLACLVGGVSGQSVALEEVAVIPSDGTILGSVSDVDVLPDGRVVVLDGQARTVYVFGQDGRLAMTLGGEGEGPGEIKVAAEVEVGPDGTIAVADAGNLRLTRWSASGELLGSTRLDVLLGMGMRWPHDLRWSRAGLFLKTSVFQPDEPLSFFRMPEDLQGAAELVVQAQAGDDGETCTFCAMTVDHEGAILSTVGDTLYLVAELTGGEGTGRAWKRSDLPAVPRTQAELDRLAEASRRFAGREGGAVGPFPPFKTRFGPHSLDIDVQGRLWAAPRVAEGAHGFFDVFASPGARPVSLPAQAPVNGFRIRGSWLVAGSESEFGEPVVRLYRLTGR